MGNGDKTIHTKEYHWQLAERIRDYFNERWLSDNEFSNNVNHVLVRGSIGKHEAGIYDDSDVISDVDVLIFAKAECDWNAPKDWTDKKKARHNEKNYIISTNEPELDGREIECMVLFEKDYNKHYKIIEKDGLPVTVCKSDHPFYMIYPDFLHHLGDLERWNEKNWSDVSPKNE